MAAEHDGISGGDGGVGGSVGVSFAGVDAEDPNTVGHRYDGTPFALPGIVSTHVHTHT